MIEKDNFSYFYIIFLYEDLNNDTEVTILINVTDDTNL